ncbi:MAG: protein-export chaperone SecB [Erysipelotrichales bacterium]|nr:protein-export chaperone SecB [Erysipelotrichales bacterium]
MEDGQVPVSILKLHKIVVDKITFDRKEDCDTDSKLNFTINNSISQSSTIGSSFKVSVCTEILNEKKDIRISVTMSGYFDFETQEEISDSAKRELMEKNTLAILFPYVRSFITTLTAQSGLKPVILPPINIIALIEQRHTDIGDKS